MRIGKRQIGDGAPVYIVAELGVNHDGSPSLAMQLVEAAAEAGADAIKLQLFRTDLLMSKAAKLAAYQRAAGERDPVSMLRRLELSIEQMSPLVRRAHAAGMNGRYASATPVADNGGGARVVGARLARRPGPPCTACTG